MLAGGKPAEEAIEDEDVKSYAQPVTDQEKNQPIQGEQNHANNKCPTVSFSGKDTQQNEQSRRQQIQHKYHCFATPAELISKTID